MTITVTPTAQPSTGPTSPPRIRLDVAASAGETATTLTRLNPDGRVVPVRTTDGNPVPISSAVALVYDYEAPYSAPVTYSSQESPGTVSAPVTLTDTRVWLVHPGVPALSRPVELLADSLGEETWDVQQSVLWPLGRETPLPITDGQRKAPASSLTLAVDTLDDLAALRNLLRDAGTLLLNIPATLGYGVDTAYIFVGPVRNRRPSTIGADPYRALTLPYQVVDMPAGGSQAQRTLADLATYPTLAALSAAYPSLFAAAAGP